MFEQVPQGCCFFALVAAWSACESGLRSLAAASAALLTLMYMHAKHSARAPLRPVIQLDDGSKNDLGGAFGGVGWTARRTVGKQQAPTADDTVCDRH